MKKLLLISAAACMVAAPAFAATKILFLGNNTLMASNSPTMYYRPDNITKDFSPDERGGADRLKVGGIGAMFKQMAKQVGLDYEIYNELLPNTQLDQHIAQKMDVISQPWDIVVANLYTTLSQGHPGDPTEAIAGMKKVGDALYAKNPNVKFYLLSTWARADMTLGPKSYLEDKEKEDTRTIDLDSKGPWFGKTPQQMGKDLQAGAEKAATPAAHSAGVIPLALAFNRALDTGIADPNPYDDVGASKMNFWSSDNYHGSQYMSYLSAITTFGKITGIDPMALWAKNREQVAAENFISPEDGKAIAKVAHDTLVATGVQLKMPAAPAK